jgi:hypothetical protein
MLCLCQSGEVRRLKTDVVAEAVERLPGIVSRIITRAPLVDHALRVPYRHHVGVSVGYRRRQAG